MEDKANCYKIQGGQPVLGKIKCMGAKNFATKAMLASILAKNSSILYNMPQIGDVEITKLLLESIGVNATWQHDDTLYIDPSNIDSSAVSMPDSRTNRIPILLLSVLIHRFQEVKVPIAGGDAIGKRNIDFHLNALKAFGVDVVEDENSITAKKSSNVKGAHINLPYPSVGATETCIFLSVLAEGTSVITNIAIEPEIISLITMLRFMGAAIFLDVGRNITIHGVSTLSGTKFHIPGDRIEAASFASLACASDGEIEVSGISAEYLGNFLSFYMKVGGGYEFISEDTIKFFRASKLKPICLETDVYPGFSTDWQQPFAVLLTQADGMSIIHETVYENRFSYLKTLNLLGAKTQVTSSCLGSVNCRYKNLDHMHSALIYGKADLTAIDKAIHIPDVRAGLTYIISAILAKGTTYLIDIHNTERGYGNLQKKLKRVNIEIERFYLRD
ncbi:MAG: UDP-N-acetylglucosamine 1-carboxyvinyltransferase [Proteobacteria bacterium]|nr:UDP-N-acetylglucosamine 1-carboxyvinyltransferase [Pseudomonadota bacterium]